MDARTPFAARLEEMAAGTPEGIFAAAGRRDADFPRGERAMLREGLARMAAADPGTRAKLVAGWMREPATRYLDDPDPRLAGVPTARLEELAAAIDAAHAPRGAGGAAPARTRIAVRLDELVDVERSRSHEEGEEPVVAFLKAARASLSVDEHVATGGGGSGPTGRTLTGADAVSHLAATFGPGRHRGIDVDVAEAERAIAAAGRTVAKAAARGFARARERVDDLATTTFLERLEAERRGRGIGRRDGRRDPEGR